MRWKRGLLLSVVILSLLSVIIVVFYQTGGKSLINLYFNYLSQDISDKKYTWDDFTDRGAGQPISGYYAGTVGDNVWIWTLSGLQRYSHLDGTSVYHYFDVCEAVRNIASRDDVGDTLGEPVTLPTDPTFDISGWVAKANVGDYVALKWIEQDGKRVIDKLQGTSNQYYPLERIRIEQCQN